MTNNRSVYRDLARYNRRANAELFAVLGQLTPQARRRDTGSYFGSLDRLTGHIITADRFWLMRFRAILPESAVLSDRRLIPEELSWGMELPAEFADLQQERRYVDEGIIAWFEECPEEQYAARFDYLDSSGATKSAIAAKAFEFLFVHQIHHRGQISQVLDTLGLPNNIAENGAFLEGE